jgi:LacI family repressor for deo operon, udp, cdd, tsx, nupC, and nupG
VDDPRKIPTIQDVARHAKVSAATVSRVLSNSGRVSEITRSRVHAAVQQTGYTINQAARTLRMQRAKTILMALPGIGNPFYSTVLEAAMQVATARGYGLLVTGRLGADPARWLRDYYVSNRADGLLLFDGTLVTQTLHDIAGDDHQMPLVASYDDVPDARLNSVVTDNREAAARAVAHLADFGHRKIGHVNVRNESDLSQPHQRLAGFLQEMRDRQLEIREDWMVPGDFSMAGGRKAAAGFLAQKDRPTAIFTANDELAIGLIAGFREAGVECPRDISVIGFDDITVSQNYFPPLSTMRQPREQLGRVATETLINILEGNTDPSAEPVHVVLPSELVVRSSTARIGSG